MLVTLTIIRYRRLFIPFALLSMAIFHLPLFLNKKIRFYKLMGSGKNGTFDKHPDWQQWAVLVVHNTAASTCTDQVFGAFINKWLAFFRCETWTIFLEPMEGHGKWDKKEVFGALSAAPNYNGPVAILTRATIRFSKLGSFWKNVNPVAAGMAAAKGFITSFGIGEVPYIKQATFSIWENKEAMKQFAYNMQEHSDVIKRTRQERWYSEEMFVRFRPLKSTGTIRGIDPLAGKL
ncbi:MAG: spheroidene monooxygenase [Ferruginibacter sp.]